MTRSKLDEVLNVATIEGQTRKPVESQHNLFESDRGVIRSIMPNAR